MTLKSQKTPAPTASKGTAREKYLKELATNPRFVEAPKNWGDIRDRWSAAGEVAYGSETDSPNGSPTGQLHSSLNGGSLEQGGIDGLVAPGPPLDAAPLLDVDTLRDP
jgi:hypothetical protein